MLPVVWTGDYDNIDRPYLRRRTFAQPGRFRLLDNWVRGCEAPPGASSAQDRIATGMVILIAGPGTDHP